MTRNCEQCVNYKQDWYGNKRMGYCSVREMSVYKTGFACSQFKKRRTLFFWQGDEA